MEAHPVAVAAAGLMQRGLSKLGVQPSTTAEELSWSIQDWSWNPYKLTAAPNDSKQAAIATAQLGNGKSLLSQVGTAALHSAHFQHSSSIGSNSGEGEPLRGGGKGKGPPVCQVEGCGGDLRELKEYHQRYKICEHHLKVPSIMREGRRQRFCQQCGRFHDIGEFDGDKRSCRARLQRHNARRRKKTGEGADVGVRVPAKKQPVRRGSRDNLRAEEPKPVTRQKVQHTSEPEDERLAKAPRSARAGSSPNWGGGGPPGPDVSLEHALSELLQDRTKGQIPLDAIQGFLADKEGGAAEANRPEENLSSGSVTMHVDLLQGQGQGSRGQHPASSALEASMAGYGQAALPEISETFEYAYSTMQPTLYPPTSSANLDSAQYYGTTVQTGQPGIGSLTRHASGGTSSLGTPLSAALASNPMQVDYSQLDFGSQVSSATLAQQYAAASAQYQALCAQAGISPEEAMQPYLPPLQSTNASPGSALAEAHSMMLGLGQAPLTYTAEEQLTRLSAKLFNCTPAHLPPDLKDNLVGLLNCGMNNIEGYIRPGCVHLTLNALLQSQQDTSLKDIGVRQAVEQLISGQGGHFWTSETVLVQLHDEVALVKEGKVLHVLSASGSSGVFPVINRVSPICVLDTRPDMLTIEGTNISTPDNFILARCQGTYVPLRLEEIEEPAEAENNFLQRRETIRLRLPEDWPSGAVQIEIARGGFLSKPKPVLILDDEAAVKEIRRLEIMPIPGVDVDQFLMDMDRCLEFRNILLALQAGGEDVLVRDFTSEDIATLGVAGRRLLTFAVSLGFPAVASLVLAAASADCSTIAEVVHAVNEGLVDGMTLMHLAVRTKNHDLVTLLLEWGISDGSYSWLAAEAGLKGVTPLHFAAMLDDEGKMVDILTDFCEDGLDAWAKAKAFDGTTPRDFAQSMQHTSHITLVEEKLAAEEEYEEDGGDKAYVEPVLAKDSSHKVAGDEGQVPHSSQVDESCTRASGSGVGPSTEPSPESVLIHRKPKKVVDSMDSYGNGKISHGMDGREMSGKGAKDVGYGAFDDYYMDCELYGVKVAPTVFDRTSAVVSASLIAGIGGMTLFLRYYVDYFMD